MKKLIISTLPLLLLLAIDAMPIEPLFEAPTSLAAGVEPSSACSADFDKDGNLDLAVVNQGSNEVSIFLNKAGVTFEPPVHYGVGDDPEMAVTADFNEDGYVDLGVGGNPASVLINKGDGTFTDAVPLGTEGDELSVVAGDFDDDGHDDLVMTGAILFGNGNGTFQVAIPLAIAGMQVIAADFDGDQVPDLAATDNEGVLIGISRADGTFEDPIHYVVGDDWHSFLWACSADLDGDDKVDLALTSLEEGVHILFNNGNGTFQNAVSMNNSHIAPIVSADFNGDELEDLALALLGLGRIGILINNGDGTFKEWLFRFTSSGFVISLLPADIDGDQRCDLVCTGGEKTDVLLGHGDGTLQIPQRYSTFGSTYGLSLADLDGINGCDVAAAVWQSPGDAVVLLNRGDGTLDLSSEYEVGNYPYSVLPADLDGDGYGDLTVANSGSDNVSVLISKGDGTFSEPPRTYATGSNPYSLCANDFDHNGSYDLAVASYGSSSPWQGSVNILWNDGSGILDDQNPGIFATGLGTWVVLDADFNDDNWPDLAAANFESEDVSILMNNRDGTFESTGSYPTNPTPEAMFSADFNGDEMPDLVVANWATDNISVLFNEGDGIFSGPVSYSVGGNPFSVYANDFDGDLDCDIVVANYDSKNITVLLNCGDGTFDRRLNHTLADSPASVSGADLDGDLDIDLVASWNGGISVIFNRTDVPAGGSPILQATLAMLPEDYTADVQTLETINQGQTITVPHNIEHLSQRLRVILNWAGSEMNLKVKRPDGSIYGEWRETTPPIDVIVNPAVTGTWSYEIMAVSVPQDNYPVALVVGSTPLASVAGTLAPWLPGEVWWCSQGQDQCTHNYDAVRYGWDFNFGGGSEDLLKPVTATTEGIVKDVYAGDGTNGGWGKVVVWQSDQGGYERHAHLDAVFVRTGDRIHQGQVVGLCGNTGSEDPNDPYSPHIHYQHQDAIDGNSVFWAFDDIGNPAGPENPCTYDDKGWNQHVSRNVTLLRLAYDRYGPELIGNPEYEMWDLGTAASANVHHPWFHEWNRFEIYRDWGISNNCVIQHLDGGFYWDGAIVYDALGGGKRAYVIHSGFWHDGSHGHGWTDQGGPTSPLGMPITDEYDPGTVQARQDFQLGYLLYEQGALEEVSIHPYGEDCDDGNCARCAPGWTSAGWSPQLSYQFAQVYEDNGAHPEVGFAVYEVMEINGLFEQPFDGGAIGPCRIVYDPLDESESRVQLEPGQGAVGTLVEATAELPSGCTPQLENLEVIDQGETRVTTHDVTPEPQALRVILNWDGSELNLKVRQPDGSIYGEWQSSIPPIVAEFIPMESGMWTYEVTAIDVPYDDYPFALVVGSTPLGTIHGSIADAGGVGLYGVNVDLFDEDGDSLLTVVTDETGAYAFDLLRYGDYAVSVATPLGYYAEEEIKVLSLASEEAVVDFTLTQLEITPQQRSRGYWAHQLYKVLEGKPQDYTIADFSKFGGLIEEHFYNNLINPVEFYHVPQPALQADSMEIMRMLLHMGDRDEQYPFPKRIARAQLLALMLNVVSGKVHQMHPITADSLTISQVLTYCDLVLNDELEPMTDTIPGYSRDSTEWYPYIVAGYILHMANVGLEIPAGLVPPDIDNIAYRLGIGRGGLPSEFVLRQNYPNPFNPVTEIEFALPEACHARLEIFNVLGQRVTTLVDKQMPAGYHRIRWDGSAVATGVYLYRIQAGDFVESKKMVLIK